MEPTPRWLLEEGQPSIRFLTLTQVVNRPRKDPDVREAYSRITKRGWAAQILKEQLPDFDGFRGYWHNYVLLNRPKYVATLWKFLVLVDLGLTAENTQLGRTCETLSERYLKNEEGYHLCTTANVVRGLLLAGYDNQGRVSRALDWLVGQQKEDGGWHCFESKAGTIDCWEPLSAYAALPKVRWTKGIAKSAERGAQFYLDRELFREGPRRYEPWFRFHYPIHYYYDLLVGLDVLTSIGFSGDRRMKFALGYLKKRRHSDGKWVLDALNPDIAPDLPESEYSAGPPFEPYPAVPFGLERVGMPSKMVTLRALRVLRRAEDTN